MSDTCAACGILFGGNENAVACYVAELGYICQWCYQEYKKYGMAAFTKNIGGKRHKAG